ncbi:MAG: DUF4404 family protein [Verrucomicrobia bacterium]|nr:DUF4404 family protein [Verrucomicrobiota bacterium]MCF7709243.1 DUF4404 family protein [Verrucomicrobiota bacterium]
MLEKKINEIEERIKNSPSMSQENRDNLLELLNGLRSEVRDLSSTNEDAAHQIAALTDNVTKQAEDNGVSSSFREALDELSLSVSDFKNSHPRLVNVVNRLCHVLANLGV